MIRVDKLDIRIEDDFNLIIDSLDDDLDSICEKQEEEIVEKGEVKKEIDLGDLI